MLRILNLSSNRIDSFCCSRGGLATDAAGSCAGVLRGTGAATEEVPDGVAPVPGSPGLTSDGADVAPGAAVGSIGEDPPPLGAAPEPPPMP